MKTENKLMIRALKGEKTERTPVWLMRQAGRFLPEYRKTRASADGFLDLCYSPDLAVEVTLQPIRRFGFDASIVFSDILVIPHALGQKVWFEEGVGPKLQPLQSIADLEKLTLDNLHSHLSPVYETLGRLREDLPKETTLIGFAGAPWTVVSYMIEGGSSKDYAKAKTWAYSNPLEFDRIIDLVVEATTLYLIKQIESGAETVQIFDSWAGVWPEFALKRWCLEPCKKIISGIKAVYPDVPVILFPRGVGDSYPLFARESGADALGLDTTLSPLWARDNIQSHVTVQGNLDPLLLVAGGSMLDQSIDSILSAFTDGPFIFNLGHGILPQTPIEHVEQMLKRIRG
ncbi:uroporphyrinogen decarboxylase [Kiloniella laminariae]|uniref:uroporphyrinogen decarboxylase n=1 Tax=Kiloniella laminariae TaxID=454162 RepID=UPI000367328F|nr:uroporphyrinogen decarboxylase [Kiloniella laminariae]